MAITQTEIEPHWNYLLAIEADLETLSRYVEFTAANNECYSIEMARILMAAAAETDVVCKQICKKIDPNSTASNINEYRAEITAAFPIFADFKVVLPRYGLTLCPWDEWKNTGGVPRWWTAYNKTKHERNSEYHRANLKNVLNAVAGLFVAVLYLYDTKATNGELQPMPRLLRAGEEFSSGTTYHGYAFGENYRLTGTQT